MVSAGLSGGAPEASFKQRTDGGGAPLGEAPPPVQRPCGHTSPTWLWSPAAPSVSLCTASGTSPGSGSRPAPLRPLHTSPLFHRLCAHGFPASHSRALVPVEGPPPLSRDCGGAGAAGHASFVHVGPHSAAPARPGQPPRTRDAVTSRAPQGALSSCRLSGFLVHQSESRAGAGRASWALPEPRSATCRTAQTRHGPRRRCRRPTRRGARGPLSPCRRWRMAAQVRGGDSQVGSRATRHLGATLGAQRPHGCGFASQEELACLTCS